VLECLRCGLVFTHPRPGPEALLREYRETQDEDYFLESDSRCMNAYLCLAFIRRFAPSGRLLDVGCSTGFFLNAARVSYDVAGVEPSEWGRRYAAERLRLPPVAATFEEARFPDQTFDVATLIDVIEHLSDPSSSLLEVRRVLKPGGVAYIVTPDIESLSARLLRGKWWGLRPAHIYYFSRSTLQRMLEKHGFEILDSRSYGRIFTWGYWLSRLSNYPRPVYQLAEGIIRRLGIEDKFLYLDTRDSMQVVARKI
jgi:2-polyprenyl-3-methyl-5-hydroxy-6-metoxy-1,4-benzoquinol methylase